MNKIGNSGVSHNYENTVLLIDKPAGITSFGVIRVVRRLLNVRKAGHAGTLDPLATGLLIVCIGKATKRTGEFMNLAKEYEAVAVLGKSTDTYDAAGAVIKERDVPPLSKENLIEISRRFTGNIQQIPPMFSAIKINGRPLYKRARRGEEVPRQARGITVHELEILWVDLPRFAVRVRCGKGTYIRSLVHDMGEAAGCGAFVESLRRTKIGDYSVRDALSLEHLESQIDS